MVDRPFPETSTTSDRLRTLVPSHKLSWASKLLEDVAMCFIVYCSLLYCLAWTWLLLSFGQLYPHFQIFKVKTQKMQQTKYHKDY